ncbi:MAG: CAP domain-containing protein [Steroidobacteraceae bacterium]
MALLAGTPLELARQLRRAGCDNHAGIREPLRSSATLNQAAVQWSRGLDLRAAVARSGYREQASAALHVSGDSSALQQSLRQRLCEALTTASYVDLGVSQRGSDTWLILAAPFAAPAPRDTDRLAAQVLAGINAARAQPHRCGSQSFAPAPALRPNELLRRAAQRHALDMLAHDFFAHEGSDGSTPAQRVASSGYRYRVVGENLASGPQSAAEAVAGWLSSPGHCENIMDPRFAESGVAFATNSRGAPRIVWVQEFAAPADGGHAEPPVR